MSKHSKLKFVAVLFCSSLLLTSCGETLKDSLSVLAKNIFPNLWVTLAQIIAFILMCIIVYFLAYKPVKKFMKTRKDHIENQIRDSNDKLEAARIEQEKAELALQEANIKSVEIINEAQQVAINKQNEIADETDKIIKNKQERARRQIEEERVAMEQELHNTIVNTALDASKEILKREINEEDNAKLIDDFIDEMNKKDN